MNRRHARSWLVLFLGLALSLPCLLASDMALAQAPSASKVNTTVSAGPPAIELPSHRRRGERYRLVVGGCQGSAAFKVCPFSVQLSQGNKVAATAELDPVWSDRIVPLAASAVPGLGDPLGKPSRWEAWRVGDGENAQTIGALVVQAVGQRRLIPHGDD